MRDFHDATQVLFKALRPRGYSKRFLQHIKATTLKEIKTRPPNTQQIIPLVTNSHRTQLLNNKIKNNFKHIQQHIPALQKFSVISACRKSKNLKDILIWSRFTSRGLQQLCPWEQYHRELKYLSGIPIMRNLSLDTNNIVYCKTYSQGHKCYIRETKTLKQHMHNITNNTKNTKLISHFKGHGFNQ